MGRFARKCPTSCLKRPNEASGPRSSARTSGLGCRLRGPERPGAANVFEGGQRVSALRRSFAGKDETLRDSPEQYRQFDLVLILQFMV